MPSSNLPDPDKIPDMTLPERSDRPVSSTPSSDVTASYPPRPEPAHQPATPPAWQEGDSVLAPWEPMFLYPGIIKQIRVDEAKGDQALIEFDDGDEGWVFLYSLVPCEVQIGQKAQCRRRHGTQYSPGEIVKADDDGFEFRFDDGSSEWTTLTTLRIPCIENGPGAVVTKLAEWHPTPAAGTGIPSWAIWVGISILLAFVRFACREMGRN